MTDRLPVVQQGWRQRLAGVAEFARRRLQGEYELDEFGFDPDLNAAVLMPAALALYRNWFRVQTRGMRHVPPSGPALLVANRTTSAVTFGLPSRSPPIQEPGRRMGSASRSASGQRLRNASRTSALTFGITSKNAAG